MEVAFVALIPALILFALALWLAWKVIRGIVWLVGRVFRLVGRVFGGLFGFVRRELAEAARVVGAAVSAAVLLPVTVLSAVFGRHEAARHYGRALEDELTNGLLGIWRVALANPLRLVGLGGMLEGVEGRIPDVFERAPKSAARARASALDFPGYEIAGELPSGGSGALLYLARPRVEAHERSRRAGRELPGEVVIKSFALVQGSTLPQIVRESRALEAAGRLGLVYEHHLDDQRFWYVMRYVRGENLDAVIHRLHGRAGAEGLAGRELGLVLGYAQDLLRSLERFHAGGLWHKDVKPANLIVSPEGGPDGGRAHLVDFGLVTPLASAMTLTTHGTEYYRDPEMVRLAMQGVKVHEVDGVKFDLYSAGAVLYTMIEDSFPAHGSLSRLTKRCPEALAWIVRRSMAEIGTRYPTASAMLADLEALGRASDPFAVRPADLPSVRGGASELAGARREPTPEPRRQAPEPAAAPAPGPAPAPSRWCVDTAKPVTRGARGFRRLVVAAVVLLVGANLLGVFVRHARGERIPAPLEAVERVARRLTEGPPHAPASPRLASAERRAHEAARAALERTVADEHLRALAQDWNDRLAALAAHRPHARALVVESPASAVGADELAALFLALDAKGFAGVGGAGDAGEIDLIGRARLAVGLADPLDEEALARLQEFVDTEGELDALLWVAGPDGAQGSGTSVRVLERSHAGTRVVTALEAAGVSRRP